MPPIVYDGLRLLLAAFIRTPRGIDRVDFGYAKFLMENWPVDCFGLLPTPWGIRLYDRATFLRLLATIQAAWREQQDSDADPAFADLRSWLAGHPADKQHISGRRRPGLAGRGLRYLQDKNLRLGQSAIRKAPRNAVYLNVGQVGWAAPLTTLWLKRRPDIQSIFMLHDVIPLQHANLVSNGGRMSHDWMLRTVLSRAAGLITTTLSASDTVMETLRQNGLPTVPLRALPLPVADVFLRGDPPDDELRGKPYFVVCGAIEARKNHLLLLKVWRRMVQRVGAGAPRLVLVGSPGHLGGQIVRQFQDAPELKSHVAVVSGLASPSLCKLMANARAVLMPSFAEGFGLPVIEALTVGTPVLASDIPAHREAGGEFASYLNPSDDIAWFDAIMDLSDNGDETTALRSAIAGYRPFTSKDYFVSVAAFLAGFG